MEWSCNTGEGGAWFVSFFGLVGLQDSGVWAATGNDCDCRKAIAVGFCVKPVSWVGGDCRLRQTFSPRIPMFEWQSRSH